MLDYYDILEVPSVASQEEIRVSFRRLVKRYHPDHNPKNAEAAAKMLKLVLNAYRILSEKDKRETYDIQVAESRYSEEMPTRRQDLLASEDTPAAWAALVLNDLLEGRDGEAVARYENKSGGGNGFDLERALRAEDWLDCVFLLAESYERRARHEAALIHYETIYYAAALRKHRRYLQDEIRDRIRNLCCRALARHASPRQAIGHYERALRLRLPRAEQAYLFKKMAECHLSLGEEDAALNKLFKALELKPNLQGTRKIRQALRI